MPLTNWTNWDARLEDYNDPWYTLDEVAHGKHEKASFGSNLIKTYDIRGRQERVWRETMHSMTSLGKGRVHKNVIAVNEHIKYHRIFGDMQWRDIVTLASMPREDAAEFLGIKSLASLLIWSMCRKAVNAQ